MSTADNRSTGGPSPDPLPRAVKRLLAPLVRLLIARGIGFTHLSGILKSVYVAAAEQHFSEKGKRLTDSRISVMTGVHRKDVKRLREDLTEAPAKPRTPSPGARMIGLWTGDPEYVDGDGAPRPLDRRTFEELAQTVSRDVHPRTLLDEWLRLGFVSTDDEGLLRLERQALVPDADQEQLAWFFGRNLHDHLAAAGENLLGDTSPHFERAVYYPRLSPDSIQALDALAREQAMAALQSLNKAILARQKADEGRADATRRFSFGAYIYAADQREEAAS